MLGIWDLNERSGGNHPSEGGGFEPKPALDAIIIVAIMFSPSSVHREGSHHPHPSRRATLFSPYTTDHPHHPGHAHSNSAIHTPHNPRPNLRGRGGPASPYNPFHPTVTSPLSGSYASSASSPSRTSPSPQRPSGSPFSGERAPVSDTPPVHSPAYLTPSEQLRASWGSTAATPAHAAPVRRYSPFADQIPNTSMVGFETSPRGHGGARSREVVRERFPARDGALISGTPASPTSPAVTAAAADGDDVLDWEHPAVREITKMKYESTLGDVQRQRLFFNLFMLAALLLVYNSLSATAQIFAEQYVHPSVTEWLSLIATWSMAIACITFAFNVCYELYRGSAKPPTFSEYALSPQARKLLGLDPDVNGSVSGERKYAQVTPPKFLLPTPSKRKSEYTPTRPEQPRYEEMSVSPQDIQRTPRTPKSPTSPLMNYLLHTSPVDADVAPIRDKNELVKLLKTTEPIEELLMGISPREIPGSSYATGGTSPSGFSPFGSPSTVSRFQPATKPAAPAIAKQTFDKDGLPYNTPQKTLDDWNVEKYIEDWTDEMRNWLATKVVKPLVDRIEKVDASFKEYSMEYLDCSSATTANPLIAAMSMQGAPASSFAVSGLSLDNSLCTHSPSDNIALRLHPRRRHR
ncbi:hypothetical protein BDK51DRAFT_48073 [Blyttiomyces helicus]|uniref:Uncharacterized protein n=1 Tax=Blyttiomyces helicus TaxID=388810 RepID=A0A4P9WJE4_9FUNG|nr:hypothetical protein BDK51DRAFT_48073 [Blyttiomyces helicus]|eukprot:RKO90736.1 hypothetical protein BDK51DRAFT_48073 [Blyttiomyces helicus]